MNKSTFEISDALGEMDDALVSEAVHACNKPRRSRLPLVIAAAAALVILIGGAIALPKLLNHGQGEVSALVTQEPHADDGLDAESAVPKATDNGAVEATNAPVPATQEPMETQSSGPVYAGCNRFDSVSAVALAASTNRHSHENEVLRDLTEIFMPTKVPYGAELEAIEVTADAVSVTYQIDEYYGREGTPNRFVLIWFRNWQSGSAESFARTLGGEEYIKRADGVWVIRDFGSENKAVWEEDGNGFELIIPYYYPEDADILSFTGLVRVDLDEVNAHSPAEGFVAEGYMWLSENGFGIAPVTSFAYGRTYYRSEDGESGMIEADGLGFLSGITDAAREFPHVGSTFEPVFLENTTVAYINVYNAQTLESIALSISLDELKNIAALNVSQDMIDYITGDCSGYVLVDIVVVHTGNYISELDEYETDAYHSGFILECGN